MNPSALSTDVLEIIDHPDALAWVRERSDATSATVDSQLHARLHAALDTDDRIAYVVRRGEFLYNFWQDANNPRGLWRRTTLAEYRKPDTTWEVLIDLDAVAQAEGENWVWKGARVRRGYDRALIHISRGGADAVCIREFDLETHEFVADGFNLPEAKTSIVWVDRDTVVVGTDFGPGSLTTSGYPARVVRWRRGQELAQAEVLFAGEVSDLMVSAGVDSRPEFFNIFITQTLDFYHKRVFVLRSEGVELIDVPQDCELTVEQGVLFVFPRSDFAGVPAGGVGVVGFAEFMAGSRDFNVVFRPDAHTSMQGVAFVSGGVILTVLHDVATRIVWVPFHRWSQVSEIPVPSDSTARVVAADADSDEAWLSVSGFVQPDTLYRWDGELEKFQQAPLLFDASGIETRQHWAVSADGTKIPYHITGRFGSDAAAVSPRPTIVHAYGGFEVSLVPSFSATRGIGWLESGHYWVQANLRGGGEFGPQWHNQAVVENRMKVFEDHQAVLRDVVSRGYSSAEQLVVRGGSNGGLLSAVALTRYPQLLGAAVIQVPLTDMLRYHTWLAGASWMAEYGDPGEEDVEKLLRSYSPLHNVTDATEQQYPAALITTSTRDDRVHPAHARLLAHALEDHGQPVTYYENTEGGHAGAADNNQIAFTEALIYGWIATALNITGAAE